MKRVTLSLRPRALRVVGASGAGRAVARVRLGPEGLARARDSRPPRSRRAGSEPPQPAPPQFLRRDQAPVPGPRARRRVSVRPASSGSPQCGLPLRHQGAPQAGPADARADSGPKVALGGRRPQRVGKRDPRGRAAEARSRPRDRCRLTSCPTDPGLSGSTFPRDSPLRASRGAGGITPPASTAGPLGVAATRMPPPSSPGPRRPGPAATSRLVLPLCAFLCPLVPASGGRGKKRLPAGGQSLWPRRCRLSGRSSAQPELRRKGSRPSEAGEVGEACPGRRGVGLQVGKLRKQSRERVGAQDYCSGARLPESLAHPRTSLLRLGRGAEVPLPFEPGWNLQSPSWGVHGPVRGLGSSPTIRPSLVGA